MSHVKVRFNKHRGLEGWGSLEHVWRVFDGDKEYIVKNVIIEPSSYGEKDGENWNIVCDGILSIDKDSSTAFVR